MRKIKYVEKNGKGVTLCPCGMMSFAGEPKMAGTLGCIMCVNHAGQSYTADGGVVCCLGSGYRDNSSNSSNSSNRAERAKRAKRSDGLNGADGSDGRVKRTTKRVTEKVSKNNNRKMKKEERI